MKKYKARGNCETWAERMSLHFELVKPKGRNFTKKEAFLVGMFAMLHPDNRIEGFQQPRRREYLHNLFVRVRRDVFASAKEVDQAIAAARRDGYITLPTYLPQFPERDLISLTRPGVTKAAQLSGIDSQ